MKNTHLVYAAILAVLLLSCTKEKSTATTTDEDTEQQEVDILTETAVDTEATVITEATEEVALKVDPIRIEGVLLSVEEAEDFWGTIYLVVDTTGTEMTLQNHTYNREINRTVEALINKTVEIKYYDQVTMEEVDLYHNDASIYEDGMVNSEEDKNKWEMIEGVINATDLSGDLPSEYTLTKADGSQIQITTFVLDKHIAISGEQVKVYGNAKHQYLVNSILPLEDIDIEAQITFIREKFGVIEGKMQSDDYLFIEFDKGNQQVKRAMDGNQIRFLSVVECEGHGCTTTSYYFWNDQLFFKFEEGGYGDDRTTVTETRTYYQNEKSIRCINRTLSGSGGYDALKKQLASEPQITLPWGSVFDRSSIADLLTQTN